ncbi:hypothetical protein PC116_g19925 [Phytophthora cactorum]|uniref:Uncharacterized protein n=1 Tax=Phytophthora cactorum TaxID=29920 RepID=A0A329SCF2_9STRA|nr:hypothetical protein Pcac1_g17174 [Phytophthora cactorum]KAG2810996.1 hypothetical protein PC112_g15803 [Phytophthora cactorum]KAG2813713.1 hypothetical protein PC111_g14285 [Phytophthora cactorum]KAG2851465.1 hypothetical protein PC113_g15894 [Phytophthora cactorum]KAG2890141.1 hypothetical protein PC114_g17617 [Phytophthora cactorum]
MSSSDAGPLGPFTSSSSALPASSVTSSSSADAAVFQRPLGVSPKATEHRLSHESFKQVLREVNADVSERMFAVLTPQIATVARVTVGPQLSSPVRGNRSMFQRFQEARNLTEVVSSVIPEPIDLENAAEQEVAHLRADLHAGQSTQATAAKSFTKEILRRESLQLASSAASRDLEQTKKEVCRLRERENSLQAGARRVQQTSRRPQRYL